MSRIIKLAKPLALFLSNHSLCPSLLVLSLSPPSCLDLDVVLSCDRVHQFDLTPALSQSPARVRPVAFPQAPSLWLYALARLPIYCQSFPTHTPQHTARSEGSSEMVIPQHWGQAGPGAWETPTPTPSRIQLLGTGRFLYGPQ